MSTDEGEWLLTCEGFHRGSVEHFPRVLHDGCSTAFGHEEALWKIAKNKR